MTVRCFLSDQWDPAALPESAAGSASAAVCRLYKTVISEAFFPVRA